MNAAGTAALFPGLGGGIDSLDKVVQNVTIQGNTISGMHTGIRLNGSNNHILDNRIGTDWTGTSVLGNHFGIRLVAGESTEVKNNVIAGNFAGMFIEDAKHTLIKSNFIGTDRSGTMDLGNTDNGIVIGTGIDNEIGGEQAADGNIIAWNGHGDPEHKGNGILIFASTGNFVLSNQIYKNANAGIAIYHKLADSWDAGDGDFGPNELQNAPYAETTWQDERDLPGVMVWRLKGKPGENYQIQVFQSNEDDGAGSGRQQIADLRASADNVGNVVFETTKAPFLSATATDSKGNTSEFGMGDYDADGLYDWWEKYGVDYNLDGKTDQELENHRSNWLTKDVYVEIDGMAGFLPAQATIQRVIQAFANAPVGPSGIALHADVRDADVQSAEEWTSVNGGYDFKRANFGTFDQRQDSNWDNIRQARLLVYRYAVFAKAIQGPTYFNSGLTETPGDDIFITLGSEDRSDAPGVRGHIFHAQDPNVQAGTFMHELGHALGLHHGGGGSDPATLDGDGVNYKPNHRGVMNYLWQVPPSAADYPPSIYQDLAAQLRPFWVLDYSRDVPGTHYVALDERALTDAAVPAPGAAFTPTLYYAQKDGNGIPLPFPIRFPIPEAGDATGRIDWNQDGMKPVAYAYDINNDGQLSVLAPHEDWHELWFNFRTVPWGASNLGAPPNEHDLEGEPPLYFEDDGLTEADLVVTQADGADPVVLNGNITYTLTLRNNGVDPANNVVLVDTLSAGAAYVSATTSQGAFTVDDGRLVTFTIGTLAAGATVNITVTVKATAPGTVTNYAAAFTTTTEAGWTNNFSAESTTVTQNLAINTPPTGATIAQGGTYTGSFRFTDVGAGPWTATINYGDGTATQTLDFSSIPANIPLSHQYMDSGLFAVQVRVVNSATGQLAEATAAVTATNSAPVLSVSDPSAPAVIAAAAPHTFQFNVTDFAGFFTYRVNWGDGNTEQFFSDASLAVAHTYAATGNYTIQALAIDAAGAESAEAPLAIEVQPAASYLPTVLEQEFLERLNDARANPAAYGASIGMNLSSFAAAMPLAFDPRLMEAARLHSADMDARSYLSHFSPEGEGPLQRLAEVGIVGGNAAESLASGPVVADPDALLRFLIIDAGVPGAAHRVHLLGPVTANGGEHRQIGVGIVGSKATIDSIIQSAEPAPYLTGSVFNDYNGNNKYDAGEGLEGVTITIQGVGTTTTWASGGYSYRVNPGTHTVTASGGGLAAPISRNVTFQFSSFWGVWENQRVNFAVNALPANDISGPTGLGIHRVVKAGADLDYRIRFGNTQAGNPAQQVIVRQTLDADLDPATFAVGAIRIAGVTVSVPPGQSSYSGQITLNENGVNVRVNINVASAGANVTWTFQTIDPATGNPPIDAAMGFLPFRWSGDVSYSVRSRTSLTTGTRLDAAASIEFRPQGSTTTVNTNAVFNTIDATAPTSSVAALPPRSGPSFLVTWSGQDNAGGAGIATYDVYVSEDGGSFTRWQWGTTQTSAAFLGDIGHTYSFYSVATDGLGLRQATPAGAQATTTVFTPAVVISVSSTTAAGVYDAGDTIAIQVLFSENVTVAGTPQLLLETGVNDAVANYSGGSGSKTLTFTYTVGAGQRSRDLDYTSPAALTLNGGSIRNALGVDAVLTLPPVGGSKSLAANEALVIDTTIATVGIYDPNSDVWYLRNSNTSGGPNVAPFAFGFGGTIPIVGDWDGDGDDTIGLYYPATGQWFLRNSNGPGGPDIPVFAYGFGGTIPVVGDWDGDGDDTIGLYYPATGQWFLRNSNGPGAPDIPVFAYGFGGTLPVIGDWDGDGDTNIGLYYPATAQWFLRDVNGPGAPTTPVFAYGFGGTIPVAGDWNSDGRDSIGLYYPGTAQWFLRNTNGPGAPSVPVFAYGFGSQPIVGDWNFPAAPLRATGAGAGAEALTQADLDDAVADALSRLQLAGADVAFLARLGNVRFEIGWLDDSCLGLAFADEGRVLIDADAAGHGWFVDGTPHDDAEFVDSPVASGGPAASRMDLLSTVLHELGHIVGLDHGMGVMADTLAPGTRSLEALDALFTR